MIDAALLQPIVALAGWTMVMWAWLYATRIPAMAALKVDADRLARDPEVTFDRLLPPEVQWKAHNYNHLHEAPTVFYAVMLVFALSGQGDRLSISLAWVYVALRVLHSLVHAVANRIMMRFSIFMTSSFVLIALIVRSALAVF